MTPHLDDDRAQRLVDGLVTGPERDGCEAHLSACDDCALLVESYRALAGALAGLEAPLPPRDFTASVMARVDELELHRARERRLAGGILGAAIALAMIFFALAGASAWAPVLSRASDLAGSAAAAAALAVEVLGPVVRALRLQIGLACSALVLLFALALSQLVPGRAELAA